MVLSHLLPVRHIGYMLRLAIIRSRARNHRPIAHLTLDGLPSIETPESFLQG